MSVSEPDKDEPMETVEGTPTVKGAPTSTKWKSGDFTLVSSDNHEFFIDSYHLFAAS